MYRVIKQITGQLRLPDILSQKEQDTPSLCGSSGGVYSPSAPIGDPVLSPGL